MRQLRREPPRYRVVCCKRSHPSQTLGYALSPSVCCPGTQAPDPVADSVSARGWSSRRSAWLRIGRSHYTLGTPPRYSPRVAPVSSLVSRPLPLEQQTSGSVAWPPPPSCSSSPPAWASSILHYPHRLPCLLHSEIAPSGVIFPLPPPWQQTRRCPLAPSPRSQTSFYAPNLAASQQRLLGTLASPFPSSSR